VTKPENYLVKGATVSPGNFPLNSLQSRAAARALAEQKTKSDLEGRYKILITTNLPGHGDPHETLPDGTVVSWSRIVYGARIER